MKWGLVVGCFLVALAMGTANDVSAQSDAASDTDARALFQEGRAAYDDGRFDDATRAFRRAYLLSPRYALLYNIGQSELRAGHDQLALEAFEGYLRQAPQDDPHRSEVEERARVLHSMGVHATTTQAAPIEAEPETEVVAPPPVEIIPPPAPAEDTGPGPGPWIVLGGGAAVLVVGAVLIGVGVSEAGRVTGAADGASWADLEGSASSANTLWGVGLGLAGVGLACVGVGLVWGLTASSGESAQPSAQLRIGPSSLMLEGEF